MNVQPNIHIMKTNHFLSIFVLIIFTYSCVVKKNEVSENHNSIQKKNVVNEIDKKLSSKNLNADSCDLRFLLNTFGKYAQKYDDFELDEERINFIKSELTNLYDDYANDKSNSLFLTLTQDELKNRVNCYLDFLTNKNYAPVSFYKFWKDDHYKQFRCN